MGKRVLAEAPAEDASPPEADISLPQQLTFENDSEEESDEDSQGDTQDGSHKSSEEGSFSGEELEGGEGAEEGEDDSDDDELDKALLDVIAARDAREAEAVGRSFEEREPSPSGRDENGERNDTDGGVVSDSSDDEREPRNTVGMVPLEWYKDEEHIGYDREGEKLLRKAKQDRLDALLAKNDLGTQWRTIYDEYNDEEIVLSKEEVELIQRVREGRFPHVEVNPFEPEADWFTREREIHPLSSAPEPKRRFIPSKWEEKKVVKLVRALRKGWIKRDKEEIKEPEAYLLWQDDGLVSDKTATGLSYIPPTKAKLPGHEESYNPPKEYLPSEEERNAWELQDVEDRPELLPNSFPALRLVPAYENFINERFERCLDLYLCPRTRKKRLFVKDPETLVPKLPKPQDLQPFPSQLLLRYEGHKGPVRSVAPEPNGQWLATGSDDGTVKLWEVATGRCMRTWDLGTPVHCVAWCPNPALRILSAAAGNRVMLIPSGVGSEEQEAAAAQALQAPPAAEDSAKVLCRWQARDTGPGLDLVHQHPVRHLTWHARGDYFASVAPTGNTQAVLVHQLSKRASQNPFRKNRGRVVRVAFHPSKPFFFVASQNHVRVYNLAKQVLASKLLGGSGIITSMAVHPSGDHILLGSEDNRLAWYDLDLSTRPYRALRYHHQALRGVAFHRSYPLFASASDDGTVHIFHGMVYQDLMTNPLIVPLKILREHKIVDFKGVLDAAFHPTQPWIFTAGGDATVCLYSN